MASQLLPLELICSTLGTSLEAELIHSHEPQCPKPPELRFSEDPSVVYCLTMVVKDIEFCWVNVNRIFSTKVLNPDHTPHMFWRKDGEWVASKCTGDWQSTVKNDYKTNITLVDIRGSQYYLDIPKERIWFNTNMAIPMVPPFETPRAQSSVTLMGFQSGSCYPGNKLFPVLPLPRRPPQVLRKTSTQQIHQCLNPNYRRRSFCHYLAAVEWNSRNCH
eukprot:NODE_784_length_1199_cov_78.318097_g743_i0.p1 GENE.NODE_784_length_1199_cov_78.318097_g743_i0~~NODE_784_length_1199_cov_78.318097_g743_i0.p1  ORF type:complete len:218 (-),score=14.12 NODE_784_length_1199_cov_78.318097_g743_i0:391-1044(-)